MNRIKDDGILEVKLQSGEFRYPVKLEYQGGRIFVNFKYNKGLMEEIKNMQGAKWHGYDAKNPRKIWSIANNDRNWFQMLRLMGKNPYERFDTPLLPITTNRPLFDHQREMVQHGVAHKVSIWACEMGTGKSLAMIELMEKVCKFGHECWYIGPVAGVRAVNRELNKWNAKIRPVMYTYDGLVKVVKNWKAGDPAPKMVVFDESSKIKTPTSQRSQAAMHVANAVRDEHGDNGYVIEMSGTPSPRTPVDWWHQCEVACPGFLKEGDVGKFKKRLCIIEERESLTGGVYPHVVTWLDDVNKCAKCGERSAHTNHTALVPGPTDHPFTPSKNEIEYLYKRMQGLVIVKFKKDCLNLPDKVYEVIDVKPTPEIVRAAKLIAKTVPRAIEALTLTRELADGFQYVETRVGEQTCTLCNGTGVSDAPIPVSGIDVTAPNTEPGDYTVRQVVCPHCGGSGKTPIFKRDVQEFPSPKDDVYVDLLDEHEDIGRFIVWGGFTGTIDKLTRIAHQQGWATLQVDGRGYIGQDAYGAPLDAEILLAAMDGSDPKKAQLLEDYPKIVFVGHPAAGGMALTLTASPTALYYSNVFNGEARMQSEDRGHRPGMDVNRGMRIIDLICLKTDQLVLDNLKKKKDLQAMTMGELVAAMEDGNERNTL